MIFFINIFIEISIKDQESKTIMKKLLKFKGTLEGNMLLSLYEINMSGGLKFTIEVKSKILFSSILIKN